MKVVYFERTDRYEPDKDWLRVSLCNRREVSVEHFTKPPRHASPEHSHAQAQVLVVLSGSLEVRGAGGPAQVLKPGDSAFFSADEPHVVTNALDIPSVGIDIFIPGRSFDFWLKRNRQASPG